MTLRKIKVSLPIDVRRMPLLELPIKRRKKRQCWAKIKKEKKMYGGHHVTMLMAIVRKDVRNFVSAVKQCWSRDIIRFGRFEK